MKPGVRVSYSTIKKWEGCKTNRPEEFVDYYFKLSDNQLSTVAMEEGKAWNDIVDDSLLTDGKFPKEFGGENIQEQFTCRPKLAVFIPPNITLVCEYDVLASPIIYEFKTGSSKDSAQYIDDVQIGIQFLVAHLLGIPIKKAIVKHYDQTFNTYDQSISWFSKEKIDEAMDYVVKSAKEIEEFLVEQGVI